VDDMIDDTAVEEDAARSAAPADPTKMLRFVLADRPRVTRFTINWDDSRGQQEDMDMEEVDEEVEDDDVMVAPAFDGGVAQQVQ